MKSTWLLLAPLAACGGGGHETPSPDAEALPRCVSTPSLLVNQGELAPASLGPVGLENPRVAVDATGVYYNINYTGANGSMPAGHVARATFDGHQTLLADASHPTAFVIAGDDVIYAEEHTLRAVPRGGGSPRDVASLETGASWVAATSDRAFFGDAAGVESVTLPSGTASVVAPQLSFSGNLVGSDLVVADFTGGTVTKLSGTTFAAQTIATGQSGPLYPLACGDAICWINAGDATTPGSIMRAVAGGQPEVVASSRGLYHPHGFAFDGTNFYVTTDAAGGSLLRVRATDGTQELLAQLTGDGGVAVDDHCLYYSAFDGISSLAKDAPAVQ